MLGFGQNHNDNLHNRRLLAVFCFMFFVFWGLLILYCTILFNFETSKVSAFLGFIGIISGTGIFGYLHASSKDDYDKLFVGEASKMAASGAHDPETEYSDGFNWAEGE